MLPSKESCFTRLFQDEERLRIVDVLMRQSFSEMTETEIFELADVPEEKARNHLEILADIGMVRYEEDQTFEVKNDERSVHSLKEVITELNGKRERSDIIKENTEVK